MPPLYKPHKFFIGRESPKDVWVNQPRKRKKILVTNMVKEEFKDIELHDGGGLNLRLFGIPSHQEKLISVGRGEYFS